MANTVITRVACPLRSSIPSSRSWAQGACTELSLDTVAVFVLSTVPGTPSLRILSPTTIPSRLLILQGEFSTRSFWKPSLYPPVSVRCLHTVVPHCPLPSSSVTPRGLNTFFAPPGWVWGSHGSRDCQTHIRVRSTWKSVIPDTDKVNIS